MPWAAKEIKHSEQDGTGAMCSQNAAAADCCSPDTLQNRDGAIYGPLCCLAGQHHHHLRTSAGEGGRVRGYSWAMSTARTLNKGSTRQTVDPSAYTLSSDGGSIRLGVTYRATVQGQSNQRGLTQNCTLQRLAMPPQQNMPQHTANTHMQFQSTCHRTHGTCTDKSHSHRLYHSQDGLMAARSRRAPCGLQGCG